jgi:recombination protein RecA
VIEKSGTWYSYKDERLGQGRDSARSFLKERPEMVAEIRKLVLEKAGIGAKPKTAESASESSTAAAPAANGAKTVPAPAAMKALNGSAPAVDLASAKAKAMAAASKAAQATSKK